MLLSSRAGLAALRGAQRSWVQYGAPLVVPALHSGTIKCVGRPATRNIGRVAFYSTEIKRVTNYPKVFHQTNRF